MLSLEELEEQFLTAGIAVGTFWGHLISHDLALQ